MIQTPLGFRFGVAKAGFKREGRLDLTVAVSDRPASAAGVFTTNRFQAAPILACKEMLKKSGGKARAFVCNSGQANACTGEAGLKDCLKTLGMVAQVAGIQPDEVLPASTGVIGVRLKLDKWEAALPELAVSLESGETGEPVSPLMMAKAIMTTDTFPKIVTGEVVRGEEGKTARILGMAKGAGMISPHMATMLGFLFTDAAVEPDVLERCLRAAVNASFNCVTVDGDTSTNDCALILANGASGHAIDSDEAEIAFTEALKDVCQALAYMIVQDAEGGTKVARIVVSGAEDDRQAELAARAVGNSPLVKTALFGQDPNWGRIVAALGRSGAIFDPDQVCVRIGPVMVFKNGQPDCEDVDALLAPVMRRREIVIDVCLGEGPDRQGQYALLASDLSKDYVSINADYRT